MGSSVATATEIVIALVLTFAMMIICVKVKMLPRSMLKLFFLSSSFINIQCRIISTQDKINDSHMQDINTMIEHMYHEGVMREMEERHELVLDDMYYEETRYLEDASILDDIYLEETRSLEEASLNCISNLHNSYHNNEYLGHINSMQLSNMMF